MTTSAHPGGARFCPNCGGQVGSGAEFCGSCGYSLGAAGSQPHEEVESSGGFRGSRPSRSLIVAAVLTLLVLTGAGVFLSLRAGKAEDSGPTPAAQASTPPASESEASESPSAVKNQIGVYTSRPSPVWTSEKLKRNLSAPVAAGDKVYVAGDIGMQTSTDGSLFALDRETGGVLWQWDEAGESPDPPVVWEDSLVITNDEDLSLVALDATDGTVVWRSDVSGRGVELHDGLVFTASAALDPSTGSAVWTAEQVGGFGTESTFGEGFFVYHDFELREFIALNTADGSVRWRYSATTYGPTASVSGQTVYVSALDPDVSGISRLVALDAEGGTEVWSYSNSDGWSSFPAYADEQVVVVRDAHLETEESALVGFDPTGSELWRQNGLVPVGSTDGIVFARSSDGVLSAIDALGGEVLWSVSRAESRLVAVEGASMFGLSGPSVKRWDFSESN